METLRIIGKVQSSIKQIEDAPLQENEGAPTASIQIEKEFLPAVSGLKSGDKIVILTWLHQSDRSVLTTYPRNDPKLGMFGVFATRSPSRPNPIGLHVAVIKATTNDGRIFVSNLEAIDGTPVIDIKPYLDR